jgi:hypothetical protein
LPGRGVCTYHLQPFMADGAAREVCAMCVGAITQRWSPGTFTWLKV